MAPRVVYRAAPVEAQRPGLASTRAASASTSRRSAGCGGRSRRSAAGICTVGDGHRDARARALRRARAPAGRDARQRRARPRSRAWPSTPMTCSARRALRRRRCRVTQPHQPGLRGLGHRRAGARSCGLCPGEPIGVTLNEACFMTPVKSITFLVGIGARGARRSLLHPVPALLDARLRLPPRPGRRPRCANRVRPSLGDTDRLSRMDGQRDPGGLHGGGQVLGRADPRPAARTLLRGDGRDDHGARRAAPSPRSSPPQGEAYFRAARGRDRCGSSPSSAET